MKKIAVILISMFFIPIFSVSYLEAQTLKIGVFDLQKIMRDSKVIQGYRKAFDKEIEAKKKLLTEKQDSVKLIEEKLKREAKGMPSDEKRRLEERLGKELKELRRMREDMDIELKRVDREFSQKALREISDTIRDIAYKEKYSVVFEKSLAGIAYSQDSLDLTQKIIESYDARK